MRRYEQAIAVRTDDQVPSQFIWRSRLWRVCAVQRRWVEALEWWKAPEIPDLPDERVVWRVEAGCRPGVTGVYEVTDTGGDWALRAVYD